MLRTNVTFECNDIESFKTKLLSWSQPFTNVIWLNNNQHKQQYSSTEGMLFVGAESSIISSFENAFEKLKTYYNSINDFMVGYFGYDVKNDIESVTSSNFDGLQFPDLYFIQPKKIIEINDSNITFKYLTKYHKEIEEDYNSILNATYLKKEGTHIKIQPRISKESYLEKIKKVKKYIHEGYIYEANICQEFFNDSDPIDSLSLYFKLNQISAAPFSVYLTLDDIHLISSSPERYIKKVGDYVISQPIKGTAKRHPSIEKDIEIATELALNEKERAENIMIVDLVRNDLSKIAEKGTIKVEELCNVYTFQQVHQLISTISCKTSNTCNPIDIIKNTFPMGSMTGAPKLMAMKIIEEVEETKRGLYSGAVGYITPSGDFDFNVVIRSILHNSSHLYTSFIVGSAITAKSSAENEYEECLLKAKAMNEVLFNNK